jgi:L-amino acid N-acyltransferase YncA
MDYRFERLGPQHRHAVADIFNAHVREGYAAYVETPVDDSFFALIQGMVREYPAVAVTSALEKTVGFGYMRPYSLIPSLSRTARLTYFLLPNHTRRGIGTRLLDFLEEEAKDMGVDALLADVCSLNPASLAFHKKCGFIEAGRFLRAGRKFGRDFDIVWMQKLLPAIKD